MKTQIFKIMRVSCLIILIFHLKPLFSAQITVSLPDNTVANADFRVGELSKPAVFLLHGFMSTHNLNIIQIMADELENKSYTVIAPTLSLNINNRRSGANCDAVHTHTMQSDVAEIAWWIDWLKRKGFKNVIMAGFSTGSLQVAIYLSRNSPEIVKKVLLISPAYLAGAPFPKTTEKLEIDAANKLLAKNSEQLLEYHLSYCKGNFVAPPKVFLSYKKWTDTRLIKVINKMSIPYVIILGGEDHRYGSGLGRKFTRNNSNVITISGANHFFDSPYEFDFLDQFGEEIVLR